MKKNVTLFLSIIVLFVSACAPQAGPAQTSTDIPAVVADPTATLVPFQPKQYTNSAFKFGFKYPDNWFGPDEYTSGDVLRVTVGSDVVYPYGDEPETPSNVKNSYRVVVQYTHNLPKNYSNDVYGLVLSIADGQSITTVRDVRTRVKAIHLGRFEGVEYIGTLSESAQTEHVYTHEFLLMDKTTKDLIYVLAQPINVEVTDAANWRNAYKSIDDANSSILQQIVESITIE